MTNQLKKETKQWQDFRTKEAKLSPKEVQELAEFLRGRANNSAQLLVSELDPVVSFQDVQDLLAWLQDRVAAANISDGERKQLKDWLVTLLTKSPALTRHELDAIKLMLSSSFGAMAVRAKT